MAVITSTKKPMPPKKKDFDGDYDSSKKGEIESQESPMKEFPKKTRGITKSDPRAQQSTSKPFLPMRTIMSKGC